jgi:aminopeptidase N
VNPRPLRSTLGRLAALAGLGLALLAGAAWAESRAVLPDKVTPSRYDITVRPDAAALTFTGKVRIAITVHRPTDKIVLNDADIVIDQAALSGEAAAPTITYDAAAQTATFAFPHALAPREYSLSLTYHGRIYQQASGLFALDYKAKEGRSQRALFTQFENSDARRFVPCWDEPARKARFALTVIVPATEMAVSNMPAAQTTSLPEGEKRVRFAETPKMSSYLLFFGLGDFERIHRQVGAVDVGVIVKRGDASRAAFALDAAAQILPYYNAYFGTPYPLPKLDLIAGPGSSQFFGAMENWGAIFYFERALLIDAHLSTEGDLRGVYTVIAHEMAHQWFGDLVTMAFYLQSRMSEIFQVDIHPATRIGSGVFIDHGTGIVIGETAVIGDDVSLLQGVTLGGTGAERGDRHPKIGKGVLLGAGAKVLGNITIGDYAKVASGSVVLKPVPAGCTAAGVPARLVNCPTCEEAPARTMDHTLAEDVYPDYVI